MTIFPPTYIVFTGVIVFFIARLLYNKFQPGLSGIPGPFIAAYTKFWRLYDVWKGTAHLTAIELHRKHGPLVRIGPNHVSVADPDFIPVFYNIKGDYTKTGFYPIQCISWKKKPEMNLFSTRDPQEHRVAKRKVGSAYSLPNLLQSEAAIDSCIELFISRLTELTAVDKPIDLGAWLQYFAFDVVGEVTFASKLGFLELGSDVDGMMKAIEGMLTYAALCGQVPEYHKFLLGNPIFSYCLPAMETWNQVLVFTLKAINSRASLKRDGELLSADVEGRDMLSRWAYVKSSDPNKMTTRDVIVHLSTNVFAGSDTTAIALRAIVYFLCRNPAAEGKLVAEIDAADQRGELSKPVAYKEANTLLPYTLAVIKEAMRLHPSVGLLMERHVPAGGVTIRGHHIPAGTVVGINPWVTNRNEEVFPNPDAFIPERWIQTDENQRKRMEGLWELNFGGGSRKCIGRNISWIEILKVIPELYRRFEIRLAHPEREWKICNHWFVQQEGVDCILRRKTQPATGK
ncbi:hypothetical protein DV735_g3942, partial [Chaetothyriales sp. CBS 134920]